MRQTRRPRLSFGLPPDPARLLRARHRVADYLHQHGVAEPLVSDVVLAVEEAMTNALLHSGATGDIEVRLEFEGRDLSVRVTDHGRGFDASGFDPEQPPDPTLLGGRGLYLIAQVVDELVLTTDAGTDVRMVLRDASGQARVGDPRLAVPDGVELRDAPGYRESRERSLIEEVPEGFAALDWEYRVAFANRRGLDMYGLTEDEALGRDLRELFPALRGSSLGHAFEEAMELGVPSISEFDSPSIGRFVEFRIYPTGSGVSFYIRDIDTRKRRELAHEEARRRAELLARTAARLLSADEPQRVVDDLCRDVMTHLGCHVFFNYLVDPAAGRLSLNAYAGIRSDQAAAIELLECGVAICGCAAVQGERICAEDVQHSEDERVALVRSFGVQAYAAHPLIARGRVLGTLSFGARDRPRFTEEELTVMKTVSDHVAIAIDRDDAERELRKRDAEVAARDERSRLARDLHDSVTQALFAASLKAEALTLGDQELSSETAQTIEQVRRLNRGALAQMRTMLLELRSEPLEAVPVQKLLRNLVEATESRSSIEVLLNVRGDALLPPSRHLAVYRITQEALNNVVRHACAQRAWVDLVLDPGRGNLVIRDDGSGFEPSVSAPTQIGLRSMRERAAEAGADLRIVSAPGEGTVVTLVWPAHR